jgi:prolipoprotein diacylglyceryltransferase
MGSWIRSAGITPASLRITLRPARLRGQHFHVYLMAYGAFRFAHEFLRATPRVTGGFSGYQIAALACVALGAWRFVVRARSVARD